MLNIGNGRLPLVEVSTRPVNHSCGHDRVGSVPYRHVRVAAFFVVCAFHCILNGRLHRRGFFSVQLGKLLSLPGRQSAPVLHAQTHQQRCAAARHVDDRAYCLKRPIEDGDEAQLFVEIVTHRVRHTIEKVLGECRGIEVPIETVGIIAHHDLALRRPSPVDEVEQRPREALQRLVVASLVAQDGRREREDDAGRGIGALRQDAVHEETMDTAVAVLERMDEDEREGADRGRNHRMDLALEHASRQDHPRAHELRYVPGTRADEVHPISVRRAPATR